MRRKTISTNLSESGVRRMIAKLKGEGEWLTDKVVELTKRLAEVGIPVVDKNVQAAGYTVDADGIESGSDTEHLTYVKVDTFGTFARATLVLEGRDILFIEFGAGVYHNTPVGTSPNPKGAEMGYTIGSYGKGLGANETWSYPDGTGAFVRSHGTKATMPMYRASLEVRDKFMKVTKEVFA